jgi:hypothetical protein
MTDMHLLVLLAVTCALVGVGCARPRTQARRLPAWVFESGRPRAKPRGGIRGRSEASDFVVAALQDTGLRFGTDGSVASLWGYLRASHTALPPAASRPGDVLFFQTNAPLPVTTGSTAACNAPDHVALVSAVDGGGRISFVEARDGEVRRSYVDPGRPQTRRDESGRVLNSFIRPKHAGESGDTPNFAGEMVCAAVRPRG